MAKNGLRNSLVKRFLPYPEAQHWFVKDQCCYVFVEDIGSLFDDSSFTPSNPELDQSLIWLDSHLIGQWQWTAAIATTNDTEDCRKFLITRIFTKSDALLYRLSRNAMKIEHWQGNATKLGYWMTADQFRR